MSVKNTQILTTETILHTATSEMAILAITFCNTTTTTKVISLHVYPQGGGPAGNGNVVLKNVSIPPEDTFLWTGDEKFILDTNGVISALSDVVGVTATSSFKLL
jgi:hypothetical protein